MFLPGFLVLFLIQLLQAQSQNQAPRFTPILHSNYFFPEFNATQPGDLLLWLNATDNDDYDLQFGVEGEFYNQLIQVVKVDGKHARVVAKRSFDRELQEKYEDIFFYVQDAPGNKVYQSVRFVIMDIDDNPPVFENTPYRIELNENHSVNSIIFDTIQAFDLDGPLFNEFTFSLDSPNPTQFTLQNNRYISPGRFGASIYLNTPLDYETAHSHVLTILATGTNSHFTTSAQLVINVLDNPDMPPEFFQSPYYVKVEEELPVGAFVLQISARDGDSAVNNPCRYKLVNSDNPAADYFELDSVTGVLTVSKRIDLEAKDISQMSGLLEFQVVAYELNDESSQTIAQVTVAIVDLNDNVPRFDSDVYQLSVSPLSAAGSSLNIDTGSIHVVDLDKGVNGSFSLLILDGKDSEVSFEAIPKRALNDANIVIKLKDAQSLVERMGSVEHYQLIALDNGVQGKQTKADLFVRIEAVNRFPPEFNSDFYIYYINENSPFNTTVGLMQAFDKDGNGSKYGQVEYELKNGQDLFEIDRFTGRIYTISRKEDIELDRESVDAFHMSVDAVDGGGLRKSVQVVVKLKDLNDNIPSFAGQMMAKNSKTWSNFSLIGMIEENNKEWIEPIRLNAFDRDLDQNGRIVYEIIQADLLSDYFRIDSKTSTIELTEGKTLDFENIAALQRLSALTTAMESRSSAKFETVPYDEFLLAYDEVDINLLIMARDLGTPALNSTIVAKIIVKDVNDHKPSFSKSLYTAQVLETANSGDVFRVEAIDLDAANTPNSEVTYRIETGARDKFYIEPTTGQIKITENTDLDRDMFGTSYLLKVSASNSGKKFKINVLDDRDECFVKIEVKDVNNKIPRFVSGEGRSVLVGEVSESAEVGSEVLQMKAEDLDMNANLSYSIFGVEAFNEKRDLLGVELVKEWFSINPQNGSIFINSQLDREKADHLFLTITVQDLNAAPNFMPQTATTQVRINIQDSNDNHPHFPQARLLNPTYLALNQDPIYQLNSKFEENLSPGTQVLTVHATDPDPNTQITYQLLVAKNSFLSIDPLTGNVFIIGLVDYEQQQTINITILAFDTDSRNKAVLHVYFQVEDLNDNEPEFTSINGSREIEVAENAAVNTSVARFTATDLDSPIYGPITYSIISGHEDKFHVDRTTGTLYIKSQLDRETQSFYTLVIQAKDNSQSEKGKKLTNSLLVKIKVRDINDNPPYCTSKNYTAIINHNAEIYSPVLSVKGADDDIGINSEILYSLEAFDRKIGKDLFKINSHTGQIFTNKSMYGLAGVYVYRVTLTDKPGLSGSCLLTVTVKEVNVHAPVFVFPSEGHSSIRIKESSDIGSFLATVEAFDPDMGNNNTDQITYSIRRTLNNDWSSFDVEPNSGRIILKTGLDVNRQSVYVIEVVASDHGKPRVLESRMSLTLVVVDEANNAVQFDRAQVCLSGEYRCSGDLQSLIVEVVEEKNGQAFKIPAAKMNDIRKTDDEICYYLSGNDSTHFWLNKTERIVYVIDRVDREVKTEYEVFIRASEYCGCDLLKLSRDCGFLNKPFNGNDVSQMQIKVQVLDVNDNMPFFDKNWYQVGITSDVEFDEVVMESQITDADLNNHLLISINKSSFEHNRADSTLADESSSTKPFFPFIIHVLDDRANSSKTTTNPKLKFQLATQKYLPSGDFLPKQQPTNETRPQNKIFQFNMTVSDQIFNSSVQVQVIFLTKQQRVKFIFSQPVESVLAFQHEFETFLANLTGYTVHIDRISAYKVKDRNAQNYLHLSSQLNLTEMLLHFTRLNLKLSLVDTLKYNENYVVDGGLVMRALDKADKTELLKKYRLALAENSNSRGGPVLHRYEIKDASQTLTDQNTDFYDGIFNWSSMPSNYTQFLVRLLLIALSVVCIFAAVIGLAVCCCMRRKYQKKIRAERELVKAYGLDQRSLTYNDAISGYINAAFESSHSGMLTLPGTNLYAYEGSNPIWLKKYDSIRPVSLESDTSSNTESSCLNGSKTTCSGSKKNKNSPNQDNSSFYLKQIDSNNNSSPSECSPANSNDQQTSPNMFEYTQTNRSVDTLLTFATAANNPLHASSKCRNFTQEINILKSQLRSVNGGQRSGTSGDYLTPQDMAQVRYDCGKYTKIFDCEQQPDRRQIKDCCDLYEVESTVI